MSAFELLYVVLNKIPKRPKGRDIYNKSMEDFRLGRKSFGFCVFFRRGFGFVGCSFGLLGKVLVFS